MEIEGHVREVAAIRAPDIKRGPPEGRVRGEEGEAGRFPRSPSFLERSGYHLRGLRISPVHARTSDSAEVSSHTALSF